MLRVADNSGIKKIQCLKILGGFQKKKGCNGTPIYASVKKLKASRNKNCSFKKGDLVFAVIVQTRSPLLRFDGEKIKCLKNFAVVTNKQYKVQNTRIINPLFSEFRKKRYSPFLNLTSFLI